MAARSSRNLVERTRTKRKHRGEQHLLIRCGAWVVALPTKWVVRLILPREAMFERSAWPQPATTEAPNRQCAPDGAAQAQSQQSAVLVHDLERYATWDLGAMLNLPSLRDTWALMKLHDGDGSLPLALSVGQCFTVTRLEDQLHIPDGVYGERPGALDSAFVLDPQVSTALGEGFHLALRLNPDRLWTEGDRVLSRRILETSETAG